jgi:rRNA maturation endonuclease Nob1
MIDASTITTCKWKYQEDAYEEHWTTECGEAFVFFEGSPKDNHIRFCPYCGKPIEQIEQKEEE